MIQHPDRDHSQSGASVNRHTDTDPTATPPTGPTLPPVDWARIAQVAPSSVDVGARGRRRPLAGRRCRHRDLDDRRVVGPRPGRSATAACTRDLLRRVVATALAPVRTEEPVTSSPTAQSGPLWGSFRLVDVPDLGPGRPLARYCCSSRTPTSPTRHGSTGSRRWCGAFSPTPGQIASTRSARRAEHGSSERLGDAV